MARKEMQKMGSIPLHTLDADVDYATATARTTYGAIGIKAWIYKGKFGEDNEQAIPRPRRRPTKRAGFEPKNRDRSRSAANASQQPVAEKGQEIQRS